MRQTNVGIISARGVGTSLVRRRRRLVGVGCLLRCPVRLVLALNIAKVVVGGRRIVGPSILLASALLLLLLLSARLVGKDWLGKGGRRGGISSVVEAFIVVTNIDVKPIVHLALD